MRAPVKSAPLIVHQVVERAWREATRLVAWRFGHDLAVLRGATSGERGRRPPAWSWRDRKVAMLLTVLGANAAPGKVVRSCSAIARPFMRRSPTSRASAPPIAGSTTKCAAWSC
jgi:hypothetical protein